MITLALIGVGYWGKNYIRSIDKIKNVNLKYICASKKTSLTSFPDRYTKLTDYKLLQKYRDIDGIIIATPSGTHFQISKYFLSLGQNLLVEKPLTLRYEEAKELEKIQKSSKSIAIVGHIFLYNSAFLEFKKLSERIKPFKYLDFEGCDFGPFPKSSAVWEWAPHDISMCLDLLNDMPLSVQAWSFLKDMIYAKLSFKDTVAFMKFGCLSAQKKRKVTIMGQESSAVFDDTNNKKIIFYKNTGLSKPQYPDYPKEEPLISEIKEFVDCLEKKKEPKTNIAQASQVIKVIEALEKSINNEGRVINV